MNDEPNANEAVEMLRKIIGEHGTEAERKRAQALIDSLESLGASPKRTDE